MAPRRCSRCPRVIASGHVCDACRRQEWKVRNNDRKRRREVVAASPVCGCTSDCPWHGPVCRATTDLTADHIIPLARGGTNDGPRQTLCNRCNVRKGKRIDVPGTPA
jgi:5-methylcytosine-specific restriction endonuclease McrA